MDYFGEVHEEWQYLCLLKKILNDGDRRPDRTGVGTLSLFGQQLRFSLTDSFPLLTTKRVYWKGVVEELLWFIKGSTNARELSSKGVKIWNAHVKSNLLDKATFPDTTPGDLGPIYGFQWRHYGATYTGCRADYTGKGIDQLLNVIHELKHNPTSRRMIICAWSPNLAGAALPPCHVLCQFYVSQNKLSCQLYQRSGDMGLGVPFNIASYSLLTYMLAHICGFQPGELIHCLGDAHIYLNHIEPLKVQLARKPTPFPKLKIVRDVKSIDNFTADDFVLEDYRPHPAIKMDVAV
ncbi:thymidylate synthase [Harp seal herpesvirus]|uniref:Thymidylate synthase n=1 Tax=phocid gammaherpesvirus 3 TaxID=2560643 RepID=A0A0R5Z6J2_9GAMA|nr:thymidylate synthase [Harp seal herpesvirus]AJG42997.1 thymidylate synthase [Harp seal herpesvirus]